MCASNLTCCDLCIFSLFLSHCSFTPFHSTLVFCCCWCCGCLEVLARSLFYTRSLFNDYFFKFLFFSIRSQAHFKIPNECVCCLLLFESSTKLKTVFESVRRAPSSMHRICSESKKIKLNNNHLCVYQLGCCGQRLFRSSAHRVYFYSTVWLCCRHPYRLRIAGQVLCDVRCALCRCVRWLAQLHSCRLCRSFHFSNISLSLSTIAILLQTHVRTLTRQTHNVNRRKKRNGDNLLDCFVEYWFQLVAWAKQ